MRHHQMDHAVDVTMRLHQDMMNLTQAQCTLEGAEAGLCLFNQNITGTSGLHPEIMALQKELEAQVKRAKYEVECKMHYVMDKLAEVSTQLAKVDATVEKTDYSK